MSTRREFLALASAGGLGVLATPTPARAHAVAPAPEAMGVLVDLTRCTGCRRCEYACQEAHDLEPPPVDSFADRSVMASTRRPTPRAYTVVNALKRGEEQPVYSKHNCLHCVDPACVSACLVSALTKDPSGPVVYDAHNCMGCRYCMVACPFEIPSYDYDDPITPQVRKCDLCSGRLESEGDVPACVRICPEEALVYGRRSELLEAARARLSAHPDRYVDHVYGEHEAGGTSWLYLSPVAFEAVGLRELPSTSPARCTETIQHSIFKFGAAPALLFGLLGSVMWLTREDADQP